MSQLAERIADLTGFRDRDLLDVTLVGAFRELLRPLAVAIHRSVGEAGDERWLTRARQRAGDPVATADAPWDDLSALPVLDARPAWRDCLQRLEPLLHPGPPALSLFPLVNDRHAVGVLEIESALPLDADQLQLVASVLRIYRNFQGLLDYSERDTLTGLLNRKTFDESFLRGATDAPGAGAGGRRQAGGAGLWLGVVDIDHFKSVNDRFGHLIGDEVLLLLSRLMRGCFRHHDRLYRFGGEEFVVLLRAGQHADAAVAFERLRSTVNNYAFPRVGTITVSVGFTEVQAADTPAGAFERADKAVYFAKGNGRNQVRSHAELVAQGQLQDDRRNSEVELF